MWRSATRSDPRRKSRRLLLPATGSSLFPVNVIKKSLRRLDRARAWNQEGVRRSNIHVAVANRCEFGVLLPQSERSSTCGLTLRLRLLGTIQVEDDVRIFAQHGLEGDMRILGQARFSQHVDAACYLEYLVYVITGSCVDGVSEYALPGIHNHQNTQEQQDSGFGLNRVEPALDVAHERVCALGNACRFGDDPDACKHIV